MAAPFALAALALPAGARQAEAPGDVPAPPAVAQAPATPERVEHVYVELKTPAGAITLDLDKTHTRQRKSNTTNSQVRNTVKAVGEVTHADGFVPAPPSRIAERGPEAVRVWTERWLDNNGDNLSEYDLDHMALDATM